MLRIFKYILHAAVLCTAFVSCSKDTGDLDYGKLIVKGNVLEIAAGKPVEGIMVVLSASRNGKPVSSDTTYSDQRGRYDLDLGLVSEEVSYNVQAYDVDGTENGGRFKTAVIDIGLSKDSPSFFPDRNTYLLERNDIYLERF